MQKVDPKLIFDLCQKYDIRPSRSLGQNFLISDNVLTRIVDKAGLKKSETILEVGPGLGVLTQKIFPQVKHLIAVEKDPKLVQVLKDRFDEVKNLEIVNQDILKFKPEKFNLKKYRIVANLPYQISSKFLQRFLEIENRPTEMILMLQKEVGEKICAKPGDMSVLAVAVQFYSDPKILFNVGKTKFFPIPKVDSVILQLKVKKNKFKVDPDKFFKLVNAGFKNKRQKLKNNLKKSYPEIEDILKKVGLKESVRAQELSLFDWQDICLEIFKK